MNFALNADLAGYAERIAQGRIARPCTLLRPHCARESFGVGVLDERGVRPRPTRGRTAVIGGRMFVPEIDDYRLTYDPGDPQ